MTRTTTIRDLKKEGRARRVALWAAATWAVVDSLKKMGPGWPVAAVVAVVMAVLLLYAIVVKFWFYLFIIALALIGGRYLRWRAERKAYHDEIPF